MILPATVVAIMFLPSRWFFLLVILLLEWGAIEYVRILQRRLPGAPLWVTLWVIPPTAVAGAWILSTEAPPSAAIVFVTGGLAATLALGVVLLASGASLEAVPGTFGALAFGVPYFALPMASMGVLHEHDPWVLILLVAIVWLGDTSAYYVGSALGRHRMAPRISPRKSWEGAAAGFAGGVLATVGWSLWRLDEVNLPIVVVGAVTAIAAQTGDLVESMLKRSADVKDSGNVLPGHGGMLDRMDAILFAAPVLLAGLLVLGADGVGL